MKLVALFPWGTDCIKKRNNGAGLRVGLLLEFLSSQGIDIECISLSWHESEIIIDGIKYIDTRLFNVINILLYGCAVRLGSFTKWVFPQALMLYLLPRLDRRFGLVLEPFLNDADVVFLEYPFWATPIRALIRSSKKMLILTNYDQIWKSWSETGPFQGLSAAVLRRLELSSMECADHCVVVSEADRKAFAELGIYAAVIPNAIDCTSRTFSDRQRIVLQEKWRVMDEGKSVLFVGGGWFPNRIAVSNICEHIAPNLQEANFYIIGRCSDNYYGVKPLNVYFIQQAEGIDLEYIYSKIDIVLVPIFQGTGSSLKTIEAMSRGKAVISTSVGVRNLDVLSGEHVVVEDDLANYPHLLRTILADAAVRETFGMNARNFARQYDFRKCYLPYLDYLVSVRKSG